VALALLMLGPALGDGYVLSYDMVWVPDLALRSDFLGLGTGLPRAVPSDAVVAVVDQVLPGLVLQKVVLVGALVSAGVGTSRLVAAGPAQTLARLVAVTIAVWNPFVVERLVIGHWPVLIGYGVLPWIIAAGRRWRSNGRVPVSLFVLLPVGSLSASAGLVSAVALVAFAATRSPRRWGALTGLVLAANAPWVAAGLLRAGDALATRAAVEAFALHGEGSMPAPLSALTLGGIWNAEVVPPSRTGFQAWVLLAVLAGLVAVGARAWWCAQERRDAWAFLSCWCLGTAIAVVGWAVPGAVAEVMSTLPGTAVLRDGSRTLALAVPLLALVVAEGARNVGRRRVRPAALGTALGLTFVLFPLALMPDAAWGVDGRLRATPYPAEYETVRSLIARQHHHAPGDVVLLPFSSYRQPSWLDGRKVLDPTGRYLTPNYVAADELVVSGVPIAGEDRRAGEVSAALALPSPELRAERLAELGVGYVVMERDALGERPAVSGTALHEGSLFTVVALADADVRRAPWGERVAMIAAWSAYAGVLVLAPLLGLRRRLARRR
jgi:hypothetical protein